MYNNYVTKDLYLSSYLMIKGQKFKLIKVYDALMLEFKKTEETMYYVNEYLTDNGGCVPLSYTNAIKKIKNLIYNNSL